MNGSLLVEWFNELRGIDWIMLLILLAVAFFYHRRQERD